MAGGAYHGKLIFPSEYPHKLPAIMMLTPKCVHLEFANAPRAPPRHRVLAPPASALRGNHTAPHHALRRCIALCPPRSVPLSLARAQRPLQHEHAAVPIDERLPPGDVGPCLVRRLHSQRRPLLYAREHPHSWLREASTAEQRLAIASYAFNRKTPIFCELFPELVQETAEQAAMAAEAAEADGANGGAGGLGGLDGVTGSMEPEVGSPLLYAGMAIALAAAVGVGYLGGNLP